MTHSAGPQRLKVVTVAPRDPDPASGVTPVGSSPERDPYLGALVDGRYQVEAVLGEGGMGIVYRCTHTIIGKKVAMKVLRADLARDSEVTERFLNEARSASAIGNPHIIDISDFGQFPDRATYFIMEHLSGTALSQLLEGKKPLEPSRLLHIARQLCDGLAAAHSAGIVHRDLKPDNVFLIQRGTERDFVKILDFGIAKVASNGETRLTRAGQVFGTPHYMSPEQAAGSPVDQRGDVYALGVMLYEMASGRLPFDADTFMAILTQHLYKAPVPLGQLEPPLAEPAPGLDAIVLKCLSKLPEQRYQNMQELGADLERLERGLQPLAVREMLDRSQSHDLPQNYFAKAGPKSGTRRYWALALPVLLLAALVAAFVVRSGRAPERTGEALKTGEPSAAPPLGSVGAPTVAPEAALPAATPTKPVILSVEPLDARIFRGSEDLGSSPVLLELAPGKSEELRIRRQGYQEHSITIDGSKARELVKLSPLPRPVAGRPDSPAKKPAPRPATSAKKRPALGGGDIVNPWD